jgi:hypothetical protein
MHQTSPVNGSAQPRLPAGHDRLYQRLAERVELSAKAEDDLKAQLRGFQSSDGGLTSGSRSTATSRWDLRSSRRRNFSSFFVCWARLRSFRSKRFLQAQRSR